MKSLRLVGWRTLLAVLVLASCVFSPAGLAASMEWAVPEQGTRVGDSLAAFVGPKANETGLPDGLYHLSFLEAPQPPGLVISHISTGLGVRYQLERADLLGDAWHSVGAPVLGNGSVLVMEDPEPSEEQGFYRVVEVN